MPFEIPESWEWVTLDFVCSKIGSGSTPRGSNYSKEGIPFFRSQNIYNHGIVYEDIKYISPDIHNKMRNTEVRPNDLLLNITGGSLGRCAVVPSNFKIGNVSQHVCIMRPVLILPQYLHAFCLSFFFSQTMVVSGSGREGLPKYSLENMLLPLPSQTEQQRIIIEIERWFKLIDDLESNKEDLKDYIKQVKSKVLSLAISGKLVPQDPNDEPAIELLKRINPNFKPCDTSHYENLPAGWTVCLIKDLYLHTAGKALKKTNRIGVQRKYITTSNLYWNRFDFSEVRTMYFNEKELDKCTVKKGDLLVCNGGDVGRAAIWNNEEPICYQNHISRLRPVHRSIVVNKFYYYIFMYLKGKSLLNGKGVAINSLSASDILSMDVPFPPVEEQKRISEEIDVTFALLDTISAEL